MNKHSVVPKLRFKEFEGSTDWSWKKLGDLAYSLPSLTGKKGQDFNTGSDKYITYSNVFNNTFVSKNSLGQVIIEKNEKQNKVKFADILFTVSSETEDKIGMSSVVLKGFEHCYVNSFCKLYRFNNLKNINSIYIGYYLRSDIVMNYFTKHSQGSTRYNLSKNIFDRLPMCLPQLKQEQNKIAKCLTSIDELISATTQKVEQLENHKRYLLQNLLINHEDTA